MDRIEAVTPHPGPGEATGRGSVDPAAEDVISLRGATLAYGDRVLWRGLNLGVRPGEFLAVVGPNGSGKTSLLRVLLGRQQLTEGALTVLGHAPRRGGRHIGYVPQQTFQPAHSLLRARDLVRLGLDGHRWGLPLGRRAVRHRVDDLLASVGATPYADVPLGRLSGGEQQRVRVAQALATDPQILLCDEPLLSLDLHHQRTLTGLVEERRRSAGTAVVFVTHEINPVLGLVDRVLYLARGGHRVGPPDEVMTSTALSELYGTQVDVVRVRGRIVVVGAPDSGTGHTHADGEDGGEGP
ncbi:zinc/manganese transport system ATP-binding protein [Streptomyces sp. SceaMP-e96]|uniref:metal ABC transporter ATP-binding protein n=1 Tax=unclassified Streptomyces TaxID=2593676 RepID=UPI000823A5BE|nr:MULTISPECIES: ATP-binding cassette domain-containing protein [unclassified Streptomyces]MYT14097.1 ATP-binding cassette domain-containing protein [Streptomyces sp. SID4951]SCK58005.1 zinc/manganese transport system ATP-binding protein [Streptomyces sp. SceaMP-e96]